MEVSFHAQRPWIFDHRIGRPPDHAGGSVLRRTKLDELPQFWNVLRGDMSLVGPRPEVPQYVELFRSCYGQILSIRPGITDPAALAFIDEESLLACSPDPEVAYITNILPAKLRVSEDYVSRASLGWTCLFSFGPCWLWPASGSPAGPGPDSRWSAVDRFAGRSETMSDSAPLVSNIAQREFSGLLRPRWLIKLNRLACHLKAEGIGWTSRRVLRMFFVPARPSAGSAGSMAVNAKAEALGLSPGEWVEVKSEMEILETLNSEGKHKGLSFLPEMKRYCGRRLLVYKRLERIFLEESQQVRTLKHTVLLDGAVCDGGGYGCDRSCMYYWREAWLRRANLPGAPQHQPQESGNDPATRTNTQLS